MCTHFSVSCLNRLGSKLSEHPLYCISTLYHQDHQWSAYQWPASNIFNQNTHWKIMNYKVLTFYNKNMKVENFGNFPEKLVGNQISPKYEIFRKISRPGLTTLFEGVDEWRMWQNNFSITFILLITIQCNPCCICLAGCEWTRNWHWQ